MKIGDVDIFPDAEIALMLVLVPAFPDYRFVTSLPGDISSTTIRVHRISGSNRSIRVDRPIIDVDVFGPDHSEVAKAAREIQAAVLDISGREVMNGVIQGSSTVAGPRQLPEANQTLTRYSATFELLTHA